MPPLARPGISAPPPLPLGPDRARNFQPGPHETVAAVVCRVGNGIITDEIGLDDGVTALSQLGLITGA